MQSVLQCDSKCGRGTSNPPRNAASHNSSFLWFPYVKIPARFSIGPGTDPFPCFSSIPWLTALDKPGLQPRIRTRTKNSPSPRALPLRVKQAPISSPLWLHYAKAQASRPSTQLPMENTLPPPILSDRSSDIGLGSEFCKPLFCLPNGWKRCDRHVRVPVSNHYPGNAASRPTARTNLPARLGAC